MKKLTTENKKFIQSAFRDMHNKKDLLSLLNYVKPFVYGPKTRPFGLHHLNYHYNPKNDNNRYRSFEVAKKSGGTRIINTPSLGLKSIQKCLNIIFQVVCDLNPAATGFVPGKSIVDNARVHAGSNYVFNIDLRDFFSSIDQARIWGRFQHPPFNLDRKTNRIKIASILASLCCHKFEVERQDQEGNWILVEKNVLPQGAPTSPVIANIICQQLDFYLSSVAKRFGLRYTRYADDITFSSMHNVYHKHGEFLKEIYRIIDLQNFHINRAKVRLQKIGYRQEVTGLTVNMKPNVNNRYVKQLRMFLFYWENYGYNSANNIFKKYYKQDKGYVKGVKELNNVLQGKLHFLKMIKGLENDTYSKLKKRYENLIATKKVEIEFNNFEGNSLMAHRPLDTVSFLKYFKYDNQFGFKELVHSPVDESNLNYLNLLRKTSSELTKISKTKKGKLNLPLKVLSGVEHLFKILSTHGLDFFETTGHHPIKDKFTGNEIQNFKRNYRFGNEKSESSILSDFILNIANKRSFPRHKENLLCSFGIEDSSGLFNINQIKFLPDIDSFESRANFFTWVPNIGLALNNIFECILKHSNLNGGQFKPSEKNIEFSIERRFNKDKLMVELSILDKGSIFKGNIDSILEDMRSDFFPILVGICDFKVEFVDTFGQNYVCQVLPYAESVSKSDDITNGFKYVLTFYD